MILVPTNNGLGMERYETLQLFRKGILPENFLSNYGHAGNQMTKIVKSMVDPDPQKRPACSEIRASLSNLIGWDTFRIQHPIIMHSTSRIRLEFS